MAARWRQLAARQAARLLQPRAQFVPALWLGRSPRHPDRCGHQFTENPIDDGSYHKPAQCALAPAGRGFALVSSFSLLLTGDNAGWTAIASLKGTA
jgi:hypothetical protein